jgi:peroxiredoxin
LRFSLVPKSLGPLYGRKQNDWLTTRRERGKHQIRFLGDPTGKFNEALGLLFDGTAIFGNARSKRYALVVEDGKVKEAYVEPDNTGVDGMSVLSFFMQLWSDKANEGPVSAAENVLG